MHPRFTLIVAALVVCAPSSAVSPYAGEEKRAIKALSEQEIADYVAGKGMGFAKAAELNGYPGPLHVLELERELELTPAQKRDTEALYRRMQAKASDAGKRLIDEERKLDQRFASKTISPALLRGELSAIGALQSEIREAHLEAHLEQARILNDTQAMRYRHVRGYESPQHAPGHHKH